MKSICEVYYIKLSSRLNWDLKMKIHVVLANNEDDANGMANVFPRPVIYLKLRPPFSDESIANYINWLEILFIHELTHIFTLDQAGGINLIPRYIFGRIYFPNFFLPLSFIEGISVYYESTLTDAGRNNFSFSETFLKELARQNFPLNKITGQLSLWPHGYFPYFAGGAFFKKLGKNFGEKKISQFFNNYSKTLPFFPGRAFFKTFGKDIEDMWKNFLDEYSSPATGEENMLTEQLTMDGFFKSRLIYNPSRRILIYYGVGARNYPSLYLLDPFSRKIQKKWDILQVESITFSSLYPDFIYATGIERKKTFYQRYYIYEFHLTGGSKILKGSEGVETIAWSSGLSRFVGTRREKNGTEVMIFTKKGNEMVKESSFYLEDIYLTDPSPHPYFPIIAYTCKRKDSFYDICVIHLEREEVNFITRDHYFDRFPRWFNECIYFTSDRKDEFALYKFCPSSNTLTMEMRTEGGIYDFDISEDGETLYYISYSHNGFDIYTTPLTFFPSEITQMREEAIIPFEERISFQSKKYSPFKSLSPLFWIPYFTFSSSTGFFFSASTFNEDVLKWIYYYLEAGFHSLPTYSFYTEVQVNRWYPSIGIIGEREPPLLMEYKLGEEDKKYWFTYYRAGSYLYVPFAKNRYRINTLIFNEFRWREDLEGYYDALFEKYIDIKNKFEGKMGIQIYYSSLQKYPLSLVMEDGTFLRLASVLSSRDFTRSTGYWGLGLTIQRPFKIPFLHSVFNPVLMIVWTDGPRSKNILSAGGWGDDSSFFPTHIPVRGNYDYYEITGKEMFGGKAEMWIPFLFLDRGLKSTFPLFFRSIYGSLFFDFAGVYSGERGFNSIQSAGFSLNSDIFAGYHLPLQIQIQVAMRLSRQRERFGDNISYSISVQVPPGSGKDSFKRALH